MAKRRGSAISSAQALGFQAVIGLVGLVLIWLFDIPLQWGGLGNVELVFFGALGALATYFAILLTSRIPGLYPDDLGQQMRGLYNFARSYSWPVLVGLCVLAGVGEELLFRGAAQGWLVQYTGPWPGVIAASVLFGLVHYISFTYFLMATGLGLILGAGYQLSGSLGLVMVWHALYDMVAIVCLLRFPHWFGVTPRP